MNGKQNRSRTSNDSSPAGEVNQQVDGDAGGKGDGQQANDGGRPVKADPPPCQPVHQGQVEDIANQESDAGDVEADDRQQGGHGDSQDEQRGNFRPQESFAVARGQEKKSPGPGCDFEHIAEDLPAQNSTAGAKAAV